MSLGCWTGPPLLVLVPWSSTHAAAVLGADRQTCAKMVWAALGSAGLPL